MENNKYDDIITYNTPAYKQRKKRLGDRKEGRRVRTLPAMSYVSPFIMKERNDAQNQFEDVVDITNIARYLDEKHREGYTDLALLHVLLAAYARVVSERPGINRFLAGQRIYARNDIECVMTIKKELSLESPDTCIKIHIDPRDNVYNVYKKFQKTVKEAREAESDFDNVAGALTKLPRPLLRGIIKFLNSKLLLILLPLKSNTQNKIYLSCFSLQNCIKKIFTLLKNLVDKTGRNPA